MHFHVLATRHISAKMISTNCKAPEAQSSTSQTDTVINSISVTYECLARDGAYVLPDGMCPSRITPGANE
jgi:hypothetical protein